MQEFLKHYFDMFLNWKDFEGSTSRKSFLIAIFTVIVLGGVLYSLTILIPVISFLNYVYFIISVVPIISISTRRLHDVGRTTRTWFFLFIPVIGWVYLIFLLLKYQK